MTKHMIRFVAVAILGFALAPAANADIVAITSVTTSGSIDLDSFTAGGTLYTTATDLSLGTSVKTDSSALDGRVIGNQDNFDLNLIFSRGANAGDNAWNTSLFGGANWSDSNGSAADFFIFEAKGNDTLNVAPIFTDDSVGQYVTIASSGVNWGSTGVTVTGPVRNGDTIFGVAFAITDLKDAGGVALTNSTVIKGLAFDAPNTDIASISAVPAPETDPAITSKNPADGATSVAIDANLVATFDESIALTGSGTVTIRDLGPGADVVIPLPDDQVSVSGAVLTINPTNNLLPDNAYAVRISADAVEDLATNAFAGILNDTTWNFDTADAVAAGVYEHPGGLHTQAQLDYVRQKVIDQVEPWDSAYDQLLTNADSWLSESPSAMAVFTVPRYYGDDQAEHNRMKTLLSEDARVAYSCALVYQLNINLTTAQREIYADKAMEFLNNWAYVNVALAGAEVEGEDSLLVMCYNGTALAFAAELLWDYSGWSTTDKNQFKSWAGTVLSAAASIKTRSNNWANWGTMASLAANHIRDDTSMMASDIDRLKTIIDQQIEPDGSMPEELARGDNSVWYTYFALAPMTAAIEIARNAEGIDLYPYVPPSGGTVKDALDFFFQHAIVDPSSWPVEGASNTQIPDGKGGNLFYAMGRVYEDEDYLNWVSHPISRVYGGLCWIYPSLMSPFGTNSTPPGTLQEIDITGNGNSIPDGDTTPSLGDHTDFGSTPPSGSTIVRTYTVTNSGTANLTLSSDATITVGDARFTVTSAPLTGTELAPAATTTFDVTYTPDAVVGTHTATVSLSSDDGDEGTYNFDITAETTAAPEPEIDVTGNSVSIPDGDTTPSTGDHTDFGSTIVGGSTIVRTYTVENSGPALLTLTDPATVTGAGAAQFAVGTLTDTTLNNGETATFTVTYTASAGAAVHTATVSLANNDGDENPYTFAITAETTAAPGIVAITSVNTTTSGTVGDPQTIILDSFTVGTTLYTTATDLVTGTSETTDPGPITNQDNFDFNSYFGRGSEQYWTTISFGGENWSNSNGDAADFFIFEAGGNDDIYVRPIFADDSVGTYVELTSDATPTMDDTGVEITEGERAEQNMFGLAFAITDLKDAGGVFLTNSSVIKGLEFDGLNADIASISAVPAPDTDPAITSKNPDDAATNVSIHANLVATFDENIALTGSGTVTIRDLGAGPDTVITLPDAQVTVSGAVLTINPTADLLPGNAYAVRISADAVEDLATTPNAFAGILNDTTWNFDTAVAFVPVAGVTVVDIGVDAHSYLGNSDWNTCLTLDASGNAYAVFVDSNFKNTVAKVTPGGVVTTQIIDTTDNADDQGHNTPSIAIDGDGFLHVAYDMHGDKFGPGMNMRKSPTANSVAGVWTDENDKTDEDDPLFGNFTYPAMSTAPNGDVYLAIRNGTDYHTGDPLPANLFHYDTSAGTWNDRGDFAQEIGYTAYLPAPYVASDGKVHLIWHWKPGGPGGIRHLGSYAVYNPIDDTFSKADGTPYSTITTTPITTTTADAYQPREANWNQPGISDHSVTVNALGQPIIAYNFFRVGDVDQRVLRLARWDGSEWEHTDLVGPETGTTLGDPVIVNRNGTLHIYYNDADGKLTLRSSVDNGLTFGDAITLTDHAVKAAHVLIGGTSIGSNQEAIFFLDPSDNYAAKVMFVDYAQVADADSDGLPDLWEDEHFGDNDGTPTTTELDVSDGSGDFDGDGYSDLDEFRLGLIPTDATSAFKLDVSPGLAADSVELSWPSQEGLQFEIYFTDDLSLPLANWSVTSPITDDDGDGAPTHEWTDEDVTSLPRRFYRVGLLP